jgi:hypothetical protein
MAVATLLLLVSRRFRRSRKDGEVYHNARLANGEHVGNPVFSSVI